MLVEGSSFKLRSETPRLKLLPAVHGIITPEGLCPVADGSHVYVGEL